MKTTVTPLKNLSQTIGEMKRLAWQYRQDVAEYATWTLSEFFNLVKNLPYRSDPKGQELLKRPYYTLNRIGPGGDCDDKAIVIMAWANLNGIPYKIKVVGRDAKKNLHHVLVLLYISGKWITADATYPWNNLNTPMFKYEKQINFN